MTAIAITGVGLVTARGGAEELARDATPPVAMRWHPARRYRPLGGAAFAGGALNGSARLAASMEAALAACGGLGPIVLASCNGGAASLSADDWRTSFELGYGPVASAACASGMHALYLARQLIAAGAPEVRVVAADIITPPCHANFEALRVLSDEPAPFQPEASGFMLGEAAVALRLAPAAHAPGATRLIGPVLGHDLDGDDGISRALAALAATTGPLGPELVIGQGAGPAEGDRAELAAIAAHVAPGVPLATALAAFGHTLGASSLLSVALAVLVRDGAVGVAGPVGAVGALGGFDASGPPLAAIDGRPLGAARSRRTVVVCRALGGACGACLVGDITEASRKPDDRSGAPDLVRRDRRAASAGSPVALGWGPRSKLPPLRDPVLRAIAAAALHHRPAAPPDLVVVTLDAPLPPSAWIGRRILPTSVLEMTPGQLPQLIARAWGYPGPALCLVGGDPGPLLAACRATHDRVFRVAIRGMDDRDVEWDA